MHPYGFEEVVPKGCSKAGGIDYIVEHLGESLASCYVFGDSIVLQWETLILKYWRIHPMSLLRLKEMESGMR